MLCLVKCSSLVYSPAAKACGARRGAGCMLELRESKERAWVCLCYIEAPILKLTGFQCGNFTEKDITVCHCVNQIHFFLHPFV